MITIHNIVIPINSTKMNIYKFYLMMGSSAIRTLPVFFNPIGIQILCWFNAQFDNL